MIEVVSDTSRRYTLYVCPFNAMKMIEIRSPYFCIPVAAKSDTLACTSPYERCDRSQNDDSRYNNVF